MTKLDLAAIRERCEDASMLENPMALTMAQRDFYYSARDDIPMLLDALESASKVIEAAREFTSLLKNGWLIDDTDNVTTELKSALAAYDEATK